MAPTHAHSDCERLLKRLYALGVDRAEEYAICLHFSRVAIFARNPAFLRLARHVVTAQTRDFRMQEFTLANNDLVVVGACDLKGILQPAIRQLGRLLADEEMTETVPSELLATHYDLSREEEFDTLVSSVLASRPVNCQQAARPAMRPLAPRDVTDLCKKIEMHGVCDFVRQQPVVLIDAGVPRPLFHETFVSIDDLQRKFAPDINIQEHPSLFRYLKQTLDRSMMTCLCGHDLGTNGRPLSLNFNLTSLQGDAFMAFRRAHLDRPPPLVEIQLIEALAASEAFEAAQNTLIQHGMSLILDGIALRDLGHLDLSRLNPALYKVMWNESCDSRMPANRSRVQRPVEKIGRERIILAGVESEAALAWALRAGITRLQGGYIDRLMAVMERRRAA